jgi:hypothetical protein
MRRVAWILFLGAAACGAGRAGQPVLVLGAPPVQSNQFDPVLTNRLTNPSFTNRFRTSPLGPALPGTFNRFGTNRLDTNFFPARPMSNIPPAGNPSYDPARIQLPPEGVPPYDPSKVLPVPPATAPYDPARVQPVPSGTVPYDPGRIVPPPSGVSPYDPGRVIPPPSGTSLYDPGRIILPPPGTPPYDPGRARPLPTPSNAPGFPPATPRR